MNPWGLAAVIVEYGTSALVVITCVSLAWTHKWRREEDALFKDEELCPWVYGTSRCELTHHVGPHKIRDAWHKNTG